MSSAKPGCPSDETFTRLVEGLLPEDELRALEAHCDGCLTCARTLAELARAISPSGGAGSGLLGDRYRLLEPLGAGGMGVVYAAFDTKLSRKVAVKRLRETGAGTPAEKRRGRFLREAQLLASLSHPNVLTVHDVGGADRELYVVMELVDGAPVSRWLAETRPRWRAILDVYLQAGRGLVAAHQLGIVHRDIKPDNILVAKNGRVLVGDFGLAGLAGNLTPGADPSPTAPVHDARFADADGGGAGNARVHVAGAARRQARATRCPTSFRSRCRCTNRCTVAARSRAAAPARFAAATRSGSAGARRRRHPARLDRVLSTALDPDPGRRYASMEDLLGALERAGAKRPAVAWLAGAAVLLVDAGAAGARLWTHRGTRRPSTPREPCTRSRRRTPSPPTSRRRRPSTASARRRAGTRPRPARASDGTSGPPRHRRQMAQAQPHAPPGQTPSRPPQPAAPAIVTQAQILARAERRCIAATAPPASPRSARPSATGPRSSRRARRRTAATASCSRATATKERSCSNRCT